MVAFPFIVALLCVALFMQTIGQSYWSPLEKMYQDNNGVYSAQSVIYAYKSRVENAQWSGFMQNGNGGPAKNGGSHQLHDDALQGQEKSKDLAAEDETSEIPQSNGGLTRDFKNQTKTIEEIERELLSLGYSFMLEELNGTIIYSNMSDSDVAFIESIDNAVPNSTSLVMSQKGRSIIIDNLKSFGKGMRILAISEMRPPQGGKTYIQKYVTSFIIFFVLFLLFLVGVVSVIVTQINTTMILRPLKALKHGSNEIGQGNLDYTIAYEKKDEFGDVCHDFNEMRDHLKESVKKRMETEAYQKNFISGVSHDLRTPVTSIKGYTEGLIEGIANTSEKRERYYQAILTSTSNLETLIDSLSMLTKLNNKSFHYTMKVVNLSSYLSQYVRDKAYYLERDGVRIIKNYDEQRDVFVSIDAAEMGRVLMNIMENSSKYRRGEECVITIGLQCTAAHAVLTISDDGIGVQAASLPHIFERFYREDESRTSLIQGNGLGLAIVHEIILSFGGEITATSDQGLCLTMTLPLVTKEEQR